MARPCAVTDKARSLDMRQWLHPPACTGDVDALCRMIVPSSARAAGALKPAPSKTQPPASRKAQYQTNPGAAEVRVSVRSSGNSEGGTGDTAARHAFELGTQVAASQRRCVPPRPLSVRITSAK